MTSSWLSVALGEVAEVNPTEQKLKPTDPFIPMEAVTVGNRWVSPTQHVQSRGGVRCRGGDVLFARITPCLENGKIAQVSRDVARAGGSTEFIVLRPTERVDPGFLFYLATSPSLHDTAVSLMIGSTGRRRLSADDLAAITVDIPSIPEQRRIADLIEALDSVIEKGDRVADCLQELRKGTIASFMATAAAEGWPEERLGELSEIRIGRTPPRKDQSYWTESLDRPFCTIADMDGRLVMPSREGVSEEAEEQGRAKRVPAGSLLMSFKLTIGRVGTAACDLFPNEAIAWIEPKPKSGIRQDYLGLFLEQFDYSEYVGRAVKGKTLNKKTMNDLPIIVPPTEDQEAIAAVAGDIDRRYESLIERRVAAERLRNSLLRSLLAGNHKIPSAYDRLLEAA